jgi:hypothetical protein
VYKLQQNGSYKEAIPREQQDSHNIAILAKLAMTNELNSINLKITTTTNQINFYHDKVFMTFIQQYTVHFPHGQYFIRTAMSSSVKASALHRPHGKKYSQQANSIFR